jgi:hypothetical protein
MTGQIQGSLQITDQILGIFNANREPHKTGVDGQG